MHLSSQPTFLMMPGWWRISKVICLHSKCSGRPFPLCWGSHRWWVIKSSFEIRSILDTHLHGDFGSTQRPRGLFSSSNLSAIPRFVCSFVNLKTSASVLSLLTVVMLVVDVVAWVTSSFTCMIDFGDPSSGVSTINSISTGGKWNTDWKKLKVQYIIRGIHWIKITEYIKIINSLNSKFLDPSKFHV